MSNDLILGSYLLVLVGKSRGHSSTLVFRGKTYRTFHIHLEVKRKNVTRKTNVPVWGIYLGFYATEQSFHAVFFYFFCFTSILETKQNWPDQITLSKQEQIPEQLDVLVPGRHCKDQVYLVWVIRHCCWLRILWQRVDQRWYHLFYPGFVRENSSDIHLGFRGEITIFYPGLERDLPRLWRENRPDQ